MVLFTEEELRRVRNGIEVRTVIETLLQLPTKEVEGVWRFLCPECGEFDTRVNPRTNLARCFRCARNFNPIELLMAEKGLSFVQSVTLLLEKVREGKKARLPQRSESTADEQGRVERRSQNSFPLSKACGDGSTYPQPARSLSTKRF